MKWTSWARDTIILLASVAAADSSPRLTPSPARVIERNAALGQNGSLVLRDIVGRGLDSVFSRPLAKRQNNCPGTCNYCCDDGTCVNSLSDVCCGGYYCNAGDQCSNDQGCCPTGTDPCHDGCIPSGGECCRTSGYCDPGRYCYLVDGEPKCCPFGGCTGSGSSGDDYTTSIDYTTSLDYTTSIDYTSSYDYTTSSYTYTYATDTAAFPTSSSTSSDDEDSSSGGISLGGGRRKGGSGSSGAGALRPPFVASWLDMMIMCGVLLSALVAINL